MAFLHGRARCLTAKNGVFRPGQEFEKDHDPNGHVDFLHAMANLRARCYGLPPMAWIDVRLKAGRIIPALVITRADNSRGPGGPGLYWVLRGSRRSSRGCKGAPWDPRDPLS